MIPLESCCLALVCIATNVYKVGIGAVAGSGENKRALVAALVYVTDKFRT